SGTTKSCGCWRKEQGKKNRTHGGSKTVEYRIWFALKRRCLNARDPAYAYYGGRGITVCEAWINSFAQFLADMGPRPSAKHSIDREDNNGPYSPANCRWATPAEQSRNRRTTRLISFRGETRCVSEWSHALGMKRITLQARIGNPKWTLEEALTVPVAYRCPRERKSK
ncbi:MAG: hypothetical protein ABWY12_09620, partial [Burkholderiales bacterium]